MAKIKYKRPPIDSDEVKYIYAKDGRILAFDEMNNLVCINDNDTLPSPSVVADAINLGDSFNSKGGINYETTEKILENYRYYSFTHRTKEMLLDKINEQIDRGPADLSSKPIKIKITGEEEIMDVVSLMADIKKVPSQLRKFAADTNNVVLSANIIRIIDDVIEAFQESGSKKYKTAAALLIDRYIDPDLEDASFDEILEKSGMKKHKYYNSMEEAISLVSSTLFGVFPSDSNLLKISIDEDGISVDTK